MMKTQLERATRTVRMAIQETIMQTSAFGPFVPNERFGMKRGKGVQGTPKGLASLSHRPVSPDVNHLQAD